jgi:hypothetical protein
MTHRLIDVRTPLAVSPNSRVELGEDGVLHLLVGPVALSLDRARCEELATTLARAMVLLAKTQPKRTTPKLALVRPGKANARTGA